jgi:hypothetical protein
MPAGDPRHRGVGSAKPGPTPHQGMRESPGQNRRGTPTGERALRRVRASPQGEAGRPASVGVLLPFRISVRSFRRVGGAKRSPRGSENVVLRERRGHGALRLSPPYEALAPRPIVMAPAFPLRGHPTKVGTAASFVAVPCSWLGCEQKTHRENGSARHCEPTDPREVARSDDRLREAIQVACVDWEAGWIASSLPLLAMTNM